MKDQNADSKTIDIITYLASLVSDAQKIDPWLDPMRKITSSSKEGDVLSPADREALLAIKAKLIDYITTKDPLRRFTSEALEQRIYEHFEGRVRFSRLWHVTIGVIASAIIAAGSVFVLGFVLHVPGIPAVPQLPLIAAMAILYIGALGLFMQALKGFEPVLRRAYYYICGAIVCIAGISLHFPFIKSLVGTLWFETWAFSAFLAIAGVLFYVGLLKFARQLEIKGTLLTRKVAIVGLGAIVLVSAFMPHLSIDIPEVIYRLSVVCLGTFIFFSIIGCITGVRIGQKINVLYKKAIASLVRAIGAMVIAGLILLYIRAIWINPSAVPSPFPLIGMIILFTISSVLFLHAGYTFNKANRY